MISLRFVGERGGGGGGRLGGFWFVGERGAAMEGVGSVVEETMDGARICR